MQNNQWSQFPEVTKDMKKPAVFPNFLTKEDIGELKILFMEMLNGMIHERRTEPRCRVWIDGELNEDYYNKVYDSPPNPDEDIPQWVERVFDEQKFGFIVNKGEFFSMDLVTKLAKFVWPIVEKFGYPMGGLTITSFIGNYGFTPFGVHIDQRPVELMEKDIVHFHLGPSDKTIYTWSIESYNELTGGGPNYPYPEKILDHANEYKFGEGDAFFLPWEKYHVGNTPEFSIGIGVTYPNITNVTLTERIFDIMKGKTIQLENKSILKPFRPEEKENSEMHKTHNALLEFSEEGTIEEVFRDTLEDYKLERFSNAGFCPSASLVKEEIEISLDDTVNGVAPFKIHYRASKDNNAIVMYARGKKMNLPPQEGIPQFIQNINSWRKFKVKEIIVPLLEEWEEDIALYILSFLYTSGTIEIHQNNK